MTKYKRYTLVDGKKPIWVIVENGNILNKNPTKEDLRFLDNEPPKKELYTDKEYLIERLINFYRESGRVPTCKDFENNHKYPSRETYKRVFGSWDNALKDAGLLDKRIVRREKLYTDIELLDIIRTFNKEYGIPPSYRDLLDDMNCPDPCIYYRRFGNFENAKRLLGLDTDSIIKKGIINTANQKGRMAEIHVLEYNEKEAIDLSGKINNSPIDGLSKDGRYDVKSSPLRKIYWSFNLDKFVDYYYLLAYDTDYKNLLYKWKVPGDFDFGHISIGTTDRYRHNLENMKEYQIKEII